MENTKTKVHIYNREMDIDNYLALSVNELAFYKWLKNNNYLDEYTCIDILENGIEFKEF